MTTATVDRAVPQQIADLQYLLERFEARGQDMTGTRAQLNRAWTQGVFTVKFASEMIKLMLDMSIELDLKAREAGASANTTVPDARYAVLNDAGEWAFYRVIRGRVEQQLADNFRTIPRQVEAAVLRKIAVDPQQACLDYGLQLGTCGRCGISLTNPVSRARGMGDICASKAW